MLEFFKKLFSSKSAETTVPYKVEAPRVEQFPFPSQSAEKPAKPKTEKKPAVKAKTARKPRAPKA